MLGQKARSRWGIFGIRLGVLVLIVFGTLIKAAAQELEPPDEDRGGTPTGPQLPPEPDPALGAPYMDNYCASDVETQIVEGLGKGYGKVVRYKPNYYARPWFNALDSFARSKCHIQGFARFADGANGAEFTFDWNAVGGASNPTGWCPSPGYGGISEPGILMTATGHNGSLVDAVELFGQNPALWHVGGMQSIGYYLVVGIDDGPGDSMIYVWNFRDPANPYVVHWFLNPDTRAEAVAVARRPSDGRYVIIAGSQHGSRLKIFESTTNNIETAGWADVSDRQRNYGGLSKEKYNYNNLALIRECGDDDSLFFAGLTNSDGVGGSPGCLGPGNADGCDDSIIDLHKIIGIKNRNYHFQRLGDVRLDNPCNGFLNFDICPNFAAGGTLAVEPNGELIGYATEHWPQDGDLDVLQWKAYKRRSFTRRGSGGSPSDPGRRRTRK